MGKPTLYGPAYSTYTRSVRLALEEKGVDYFFSGKPANVASYS